MIAGPSALFGLGSSLERFAGQPVEYLLRLGGRAEAFVEAQQSRIVSVSPWPSLLSNPISPPCSRTILRTISNPRPDPLAFVVKYGSKILLI